MVGNWYNNYYFVNFNGQARLIKIIFNRCGLLKSLSNFYKTSQIVLRLEWRRLCLTCQIRCDVAKSKRKAELAPRNTKQGKAFCSLNSEYLSKKIEISFLATENSQKVRLWWTIDAIIIILETLYKYNGQAWLKAD